MVGGAVVHLDYNATISSYTQILDDFDIVEKVFCSRNEIEIHFSAGFNYSEKIAFRNRFQRERTVVHGGSEWGCVNNITNIASPFYYKVLGSIISENGTMIMEAEPCSPFMAFTNLSWKIHSDSTPAVLQREWKGKNNASQPHSSMHRSGKTRDDEFDWTPDPLNINFDLLDLLCRIVQIRCTDREDSSFIASASFGFSPMKYFWSIQLDADWNFPFIHVKQNTMWFSITEKYTLGTSINFSPNFALSSTPRSFPLIPKFAIPYLGYGFKIGPVGFFFGLTAKMDLEVDLSFPLGLNVDLQCSAQRTTKTGFEYDGSTYRRIHEDTGLVPTLSQQYGPMSIAFELHIKPELNFGLEASFDVVFATLYT